MGEIGINLALDGNSYYGSQYPFLDRYKTSGLWGAVAGDGTEKAISLDAHGYPVAVPTGVARLYSVFNLDPAALPTSDRYVLTYQGTADIRVGEARIISSLPGKIVFDYVGDNNQASLSIYSISGTDPIHDIHIVREDQLALYNAGQTFNPVFLDKSSDWGVLRFMDWEHTNASQLVNWADRPQVADASWGSSVPLEIMVRLANEAHTDMWYNIPAHASDDFVQQALTLIRDTLDPSLKLHLEYSNEVWNFGFEQAHYVRAMGIALNASLPAGWKGFYGNTEIAGIEYYGYRSAQIAVITDQVFGTSSETRVDNVLATQTAYKGLENYIFDGIRLANLGTPGQLFEEYAITTYFGDALSGHSDADKAIILGWARSGSAGLDAAFQQITTGGLLSDDESLAALRDLEAYQANVAQTNGLELVAYEGGLHAFATSYASADQAAIVDLLKRIVNDPRIGTLYTQMANDFAQAGGHELVAFNDVGPTSKFGPWGILDNIYQDHSPRYDALKAIQGSYEAGQQVPVVVAPPVLVPPPVVVAPPVFVPPPVVGAQPISVSPAPIPQVTAPPVSPRHRRRPSIPALALFTRSTALSYRLVLKSRSWTPSMPYQKSRLI